MQLPKLKQRTQYTQPGSPHMLNGATQIIGIR